MLYFAIATMCNICQNENYIPSEWSVHSDTENIIDNTCSFKILRFKKTDVICNDYGINKKYCDHFLLPSEFIIYNETGINNIDNLVIKPTAMWEIINSKKIIIADFKYTFICNDNIDPKLTLNIIPKKKFDKSSSEEIIENCIIFILYIISSILILFIIILIPVNIYYDTDIKKFLIWYYLFYCGRLLFSINQQNNREIFCN